VPYWYKVDGNAGTTEATHYTWWATKDPAFISLDVDGNPITNISTMLDSTAAGNHMLLDYSSNYGQTVADTDAPSMDSVMITWSPEILSLTKYQGTSEDPSPTFVVALVQGECSNNIEVYEINPTASFTLDIANVDPDSKNVLPYDSIPSQCVDVVRGAYYDYADNELKMDYGTDTLYFEVIAANFVTSWVPTFEIMEGLSGSQTATIEWSSSLTNFDANSIEGPTGIEVNTPITGDNDILSAVENTANGVALYVRVVISNNTYESIADQDFVLAVDGQDSTGQWDIDQADEDCTLAVGPDRTDQATHTITARPDISDETDDDNIVEPNDFIEKEDEGL